MTSADGLWWWIVFGLRRGEVCALRWKDIDLERGTLTIRGTLGYVTGYGLLYRETKSDDVRITPKRHVVVRRNVNTTFIT